MKMRTRCDCGGTLMAAVLSDFDLTDYLGVRAAADRVRGLRCNRCGWETITGEMIELAVVAVAASALEMEERLPSDLGRFLRKYLGYTQLELAKRMGITRKTVNQWETGDSISPQHDLILRALVFAHLIETARPKASAIDHVRMALPKKRSPRIVVDRLDRAA